MLRAIMKTVDDMQKQMGNINREIETLRKYQKEILDVKIEMKITFDGSSVDSRWPMKKSVTLKVGQQKLPKIKCKGKNEKKNRTSKNCGIISEVVTYLIRVTEEEKKRAEEIIEATMVTTFSN